MRRHDYVAENYDQGRNGSTSVDSAWRPVSLSTRRCPGHRRWLCKGCSEDEPFAGWDLKAFPVIDRQESLL